MQVIVAVEAIDNGWQVRVLDGDDRPLVNPVTGEAVQPPAPGEVAGRRAIRRTVPGGPAFPLPPEGEANALPAAAVHRALCLDTTGQSLHAVYTDLTARQPKSGDVERFGRYLLAALLGDELWARIDAAAGREPIELALAWEPNSVLNRLPWEMMAGPRGFLAAEPQVSITRRVAGPGQIGSVSSPPRVLFVVGASLQDAAIRPGAEYLGLLRSLRSQGLSLKTHLLLEASPVSLEQAVDWFRPAVVHFICHGWFDLNGRAFLELVDSDDPTKKAQVYAADLGGILRTAKAHPLPPVVVLNACHTATAGLQAVGQVSLPLAAELVGLGVPVVVGMAGRVADRACRLFTRRFYEALVASGDVAAAAAEGRRAGLRTGSDHLNTIDWALPTLFLAREAGPAQLSIQVQASEQAWQRAANEYATPGFPAFCDRAEILRWYDLLMAGEATQKAIGRRASDLQLLILSRKPGPPAAEDGQYGLTWLLQELAAKALRDGHLPILVTRGENKLKDPPDTLPKLVKDVRDAANNTAKHLVLDYPGWEHHLALRALAQTPGAPLPAWFPNDIKAYYDGDPAEPKIIALALRADLLAFLDKARSARAGIDGPPTLLLLLLDDVDLMGEAAALLLDPLLVAFRPPDRRGDVRAVLTYAPAVGRETAVKAIEDGRGRYAWIHEVQLDRFEGPEERMAYEHFLLHWREDGVQPRPLAFALLDPSGPDLIGSFLKTMHEQVQGIPSLLKTRSGPVISSYRNLPAPYQVLRDADDEDELRIIRQSGRG